jgi:hypothetical protein
VSEAPEGHVIAIVVATLLAGIQPKSLPATVRSTPPFALLRAMVGTGAKSVVRVVVAVWPDGAILRSTDRASYEVGRVPPEGLEHLACELEAIDLWNYDANGPPILEPAENVWLWRGSERKGWVQAIGDPGFNLPAFGETKRLLLATPCRKPVTIEWDGVTPAEWMTAGVQSVATPPCKQLVDPLPLLATLRQQPAREVVSRLFQQPGRWAALIHAIASGEARWLDIAALLQPGSDAHSAEELSMAIEEAFMHEPGAVLARFGPAAACGGLGFAEQDATSRDELLAAWQRRRAIAESLKPSPSQLRTDCLATLDKVRQDYINSEMP